MYRAGNPPREVGRRGNGGQRQGVSLVSFIWPAVGHQFENLHKSSGTCGTCSTSMTLVTTVISNQRDLVYIRISQAWHFALGNQIMPGGGGGLPCAL